MAVIREHRAGVETTGDGSERCRCAGDHAGVIQCGCNGGVARAREIVVVFEAQGARSQLPGAKADRRVGCNRGGGYHLILHARNRNLVALTGGLLGGCQFDDVVADAARRGYQGRTGDGETFDLVVGRQLRGRRIQGFRKPDPHFVEAGNACGILECRSHRVGRSHHQGDRGAASGAVGARHHDVIGACIRRAHAAQRQGGRGLAGQILAVLAPLIGEGRRAAGGSRQVDRVTRKEGAAREGRLLGDGRSHISREVNRLDVGRAQCLIENGDFIDVALEVVAGGVEDPAATDVEVEAAGAIAGHRSAQSADFFAVGIQDGGGGAADDGKVAPLVVLEGIGRLDVAAAGVDPQFDVGAGIRVAELKQVVLAEVAATAALDGTPPDPAHHGEFGHVVHLEWSADIAGRTIEPTTHVGGFESGVDRRLRAIRARLHARVVRGGDGSARRASIGGWRHTGRCGVGAFVQSVVGDGSLGQNEALVGGGGAGGRAVGVVSGNFFGGQGLAVEGHFVGGAIPPERTVRAAADGETARLAGNIAGLGCFSRLGTVDEQLSGRTVVNRRHMVPHARHGSRSTTDVHRGGGSIVVVHAEVPTRLRLVDQPTGAGGGKLAAGNGARQGAGSHSVLDIRAQPGFHREGGLGIHFRHVRHHGYRVGGGIEAHGAVGAAIQGSRNRVLGCSQIVTHGRVAQGTSVHRYVSSGRLRSLIQAPEGDRLEVGDRGGVVRRQGRRRAGDQREQARQFEDLAFHGCYKVCFRYRRPG